MRYHKSPSDDLEHMGDVQRVTCKHDTIVRKGPEHFGIWVSSGVLEPVPCRSEDSCTLDLEWCSG